MDQKSAIVLAGLGAGVLLLVATRKAKATSAPISSAPPAAPGITVAPAGAAHIYGADTKLTENFTVGEWLQSAEAPELASYKLTQADFDTLKALASKIMQPLRDKFGPIFISGGARPPDFRTAKPITVKKIQTGASVTVPAGSTIDAVIAAKGYDPAEHSDHHYFGAADFEIITKDSAGALISDSAKMEAAFKQLKADPNVRQVILYRQPDNKVGHIHVAVVFADHPKELGSAFAFESKEPAPVAAV